MPKSIQPDTQKYIRRTQKFVFAFARMRATNPPLTILRGDKMGQQVPRTREFVFASLLTVVLGLLVLSIPIVGRQITPNEGLTLLAFLAIVYCASVFFDKAFSRMPGE